MRTTETVLGPPISGAANAVTAAANVVMAFPRTSAIHASREREMVTP
jgi:hypothetical protein